MDALTHRKAVLHSIQCFFGARRSESSRRTMRVLNDRAQLCWFIMSLNSGTQVLIHHILLPKLYNLEQVMFTNNEGLCQIAGNCSRLAWITIALPNWGFAYALCPLLWPQPWIVDTLYLSFFFTQAKFLENKIYTEKMRKLRQNTQKIAIFCVITAKYTVNCQFFALNL